MSRVEVPRESILRVKLKETKRGEKSICHLSVVPRATSYTNFLFRRKKEIERSQHQQIKRDLTKKKESREKRIKFNLYFLTRKYKLSTQNWTKSDQKVTKKDWQLAQNRTRIEICKLYVIQYEIIRYVKSCGIIQNYPNTLIFKNLNILLEDHVIKDQK